MIDEPPNYFQESSISNPKAIIRNEQKSYLQQLSVGVSYRLF
jgi:hypothetical protein